MNGYEYFRKTLYEHYEMLYTLIMSTWFLEADYVIQITCNQLLCSTGCVLNKYLYIFGIFNVLKVFKKTHITTIAASK